jgi:glycosyltransferase involved in cell wall biosynthesis
LEARLLGAARWRVYDFDDALQWDPGRRVTSLLGSNATKCIRCIKAADRVVAGNDVLAEWAGQFARNVTVVPSCVDPFGYRMKQTYELADPPRLVWIGSHSAEKYLRLFAEAFLEIHRRTSARLTIVGQSHGRLGPLEIMTDRVPWKDGLAEQALCEFDVGVGPLNDDVLSRGKCAYKLLQYGAAGLPLVASPVGANATVGTALGGRLAGCVDEWVDQLAELLSASASYRREVGILARKCVEDSYSFNAWTDRWSAALELDVRDTSSVVR